MCESPLVATYHARVLLDSLRQCGIKRRLRQHRFDQSVTNHHNLASSWWLRKRNMTSANKAMHPTRVYYQQLTCLHAWCVVKNCTVLVSTNRVTARIGYTYNVRRDVSILKLRIFHFYSKNWYALLFIPATVSFSTIRINRTRYP